MRIIKASAQKFFEAKNFTDTQLRKNNFFSESKGHMIVDETGTPIEFCYTPGSMSDIAGLKQLPCDLPKGSILFTDRAIYHDASVNSRYYSL